MAAIGKLQGSLRSSTSLALPCILCRRGQHAVFLVSVRDDSTLCQIPHCSLLHQLLPFELLESCFRLPTAAHGFSPSVSGSWREVLTAGGPCKLRTIDLHTQAACRHLTSPLHEEVQVLQKYQRSTAERDVEVVIYNVPDQLRQEAPRRCDASFKYGSFYSPWWTDCLLVYIIDQ